MITPQSAPTQDYAFAACRSRNVAVFWNVEPCRCKRAQRVHQAHDAALPSSDRKHALANRASGSAGCMMCRSSRTASAASRAYLLPAAASTAMAAIITPQLAQGRFIVLATPDVLATVPEALLPLLPAAEQALANSGTSSARHALSSPKGQCRARLASAVAHCRMSPRHCRSEQT
eukprot:scaffold23310_cov75-Phaeocystis_antarctica.AAC.7